jgi:hypothetical protein
LGAMDRGCINLSFFFSILFSELLLYIFFSTKYNKDYIHHISLVLTWNMILYEAKYHFKKPIFIGTIFLWNIFLFWVIWFTYSSDKIVKDYDKKGPTTLYGRLGAMDRGCINLSFFFSILFSELLLYIFFSTKYNKDYIHCNTWHCLHSGALTDMERYRAVLDLHLSTSGIGRNPRRPQSCRSLQALYLCKRLDFTRFL